MYNDTGAKIRGIATVLMIIGCIASFVIALMTATSAGYMADDDSVIPFFIGVIVFAIGCVTSYLSYLFLAGFGELIENTYMTAANTKTILENIKEINKTQKLSEAPKNNDKPQAQSVSNFDASTVSSARKVFCGNCGNLEEYTGNCPRCGSSIKKYVY